MAREVENEIVIIFDMDGTLLDSSEGITKSVNYVRSTLNLAPVPKELILQHINTPGENLAKKFYNLDSYEEEVKETFAKHYLAECVNDMKLYSGIREALEALYPKAYLAIATNAYDFFAKKMIKYCGISQFFDIIVGANTLNSSKPEPLMLEYIMKKFAIEKENTLLIGDSKKDELAAQNANTSFIFVDWGYGAYSPKNSFTCKDSTKLLDLIFEIFPTLKA